jgi:hypothetical protein
MKTEELRAKGLTDEMIDFVMQEYGKGINAEKQKAKDAEDRLKGFEGVNVDELNTTIQNLRSELEAEKTKNTETIDEINFNNLVEKTLTAKKVKNLKSALALLDVETLKKAENRDEAVVSAVDAIVESDGYLFGSEEPINNPVLNLNNNGQKLSGVEEAFLKRNPNLKI